MTEQELLNLIGQGWELRQKGWKGREGYVLSRRSISVPRPLVEQMVRTKRLVEIERPDKREKRKQKNRIIIYLPGERFNV